MAYKYFPITSNSGSPNHIFVTDFQALLNESFEHSTDIFEIQEEETLGSNVFTDITVRITGAVSSVTGMKLPDDFKQILFKDIDHSAKLGKKFYFSNNYWICVYSEALNTLSANCMVRRCNNVLRWVDEDQVYYEEPCAIDYQIKRPVDSIGRENPVTPNGFIELYSQLNSRTRKVSANSRFLFGNTDNWIAFKTYGGGVKNFDNLETSDNTSAQLLTVLAQVDYVNENTDDVVYGIADRYKDFRTLTSGSDIGVYDIVIDPPENYILESGSAIYDARYYLGGVIQSGSFVFTVSGSAVPTDHYMFNVIDDNSFRIDNLEKYLDSNLNILCSGSSGSRILNLELRGAW